MPARAVEGHTRQPRYRRVAARPPTEVSPSMPNAWPAGSATTAPAAGVMTSENGDSIGIDTALLGSGEAEEHQQALFLERSLAERSGKPIMLFQHLPPFENEADDIAFTAAAVPSAPRKWLLDTCAQNGVAVIACGHLHVYRRMEHRGIQIVWAPATFLLQYSRKAAPWSRCATGRLRRMDARRPLDQSSAGRASVDDHA